MMILNLGRTVTNRSHFFPPRHLFATPAPSAVFLSMWTNQRLSLMENASTDCEQKASSGVCLISVCVTVCTQCVCVCVAWSASRNNCVNTAAHAPPQRPVRFPARRERARAQVVSSPPAVLLSWTGPGQLESPPPHWCVDPTLFQRPVRKTRTAADGRDDHATIELKVQSSGRSWANRSLAPAIGPLQPPSG